MPRFSAACRATGMTTLRGPSLYGYDSDTSVGEVIVREVSVWNTGTSGVSVRFARCTGGTVGTALDEFKHNYDSRAAVATAANTHSADATIPSGGVARHAYLAAGAAVIWTFGASGIVIPALGTPVGVGVFLSTGSAQDCDVDFTWDEE